MECGDTRLSLRVALGYPHLHADLRDALRLLRVRGQGPDCRTAEQRDELAAFHSISSSAVASSFGGISRPSALAVLRFSTSSNLVGTCTGISPGFAPLRMRST